MEAAIRREGGVAEGTTPRTLMVVIPTRGRPTLLGRTLESLAAARKPPGYRGTLIAENGSADSEVAALVDRWRTEGVSLRTLRDGNKSVALNAVLEEVDVDLLVFLDDDVRVAPGLLEAYAQADVILRDERVFFGGPTEVDYEAEPPGWLRGYLPPSAVGWSWSGDPERVDRPEFLGFNWAARLKDLQQLGGFDAKFGPGATTGATGQERNMQERLLREGWRGVYLPECVVWHYVPRDRCSRRWALGRAFRNGVSLGLAEDPPPGRRLLRVPGWMWRVGAAKLAAAALALFTLEPAARFRAVRELMLYLGRLKGLRMQDAARD